MFRLTQDVPSVHTERPRKPPGPGKTRRVSHSNPNILNRQQMEGQISKSFLTKNVLDKLHIIPPLRLTVVFKAPSSPIGKKC